MKNVCPINKNHTRASKHNNIVLNDYILLYYVPYAHARG